MKNMYIEYKKFLNLKKVYYYYYPYWIYILIKNQYLTFNFINFQDKNITGYNAIINNISNPFILECNKLSDLAIDILNNGIYFPFVSYKNKKIFLGQHRAAALNQIKTQQFFLNLTLNSFNNNLNIVECFILDKINYQTESRLLKGKDVLIKFFDFCDNTPFYLHQYRNFIKPNPIFQTKENFENFIKSPWEKYEQEHYQFE